MSGALLDVRNRAFSLPSARLRASYRKNQQNACAATELLRDWSGLREHAALLSHIAWVLLTYMLKLTIAACGNLLESTHVCQASCMPRAAPPRVQM